MASAAGGSGAGRGDRRSSRGKGKTPVGSHEKSKKPGAWIWRMKENLIEPERVKAIQEALCTLVESVINGNMVGSLVYLMQTAEFGVRYEAAAWAIASAACGGIHDQIKYLVSQGCIKAFCDLFSYSDTSMLMVCLVGLHNILKAGDAEKSPWGCNVNMYAQMIEDNGWLDKIENLQNHDNSRIVEMAACLLETYWSKEDIAMPMPWDDPSLGLAEDPTLDFDFFSRPGDCDFGQRLPSEGKNTVHLSSVIPIMGGLILPVSEKIPMLPWC
ncbi:importin subunit alpha-1b [Panicum miliaceum]|uniref:Importin subunit alpha-1b n=1 Tax=Panicum miliaceum TaxID=4540 RepID=A0A3L6QVY9_PANMI|nr:importin subunit alpha-1b [Panicum miliaceum]